MSEKSHPKPSDLQHPMMLDESCPTKGQARVGGTGRVGGKRKGTPVSARMVESARANAQKSTGPKTPQGKAASSRNAWKHGGNSAINGFFEAGKASVMRHTCRPCKTTCAAHPNNPNRSEHECGFVVRGETKAGGNCMDQRIYVNAFQAIIAAVQDGEMDGMHGLMASQQAMLVDVLHRLIEDVQANDIIRRVPAIDRDGKIITGDNGKPVIVKESVNPALDQANKILATMGINLPELLATPAAQAKAKTEETTADSMQTIVAGIGAVLNQRTSDMIEADPAELIAHDEAE